MSKDSDVHVTGIGFTGLLTIVFVTLKLCKVIDWPWLWIVSPLWIGFLGSIALLLFAILLRFVADKLDSRSKRNERS